MMYTCPVGVDSNLISGRHPKAVYLEPFSCFPDSLRAISMTPG
jgi:hypothetical protein